MWLCWSGQLCPILCVSFSVSNETMVEHGTFLNREEGSAMEELRKVYN